MRKRLNRRSKPSTETILVDIVLALAAVAIIVDVTNALSLGKLFGVRGLSSLIVSLITSLILYLLIDNSFRRAEQRRQRETKAGYALFFGDESIRFVRMLIHELHASLYDAMSNALTDGRIRKPAAVGRRARALFVADLRAAIQNLPYFVENLQDRAVTQSIENYFQAVAQTDLSKVSPAELTDWTMSCDDIIQDLDRHVKVAYPDLEVDPAGWNTEKRASLATKIRQKFEPPAQQTDPTDDRMGLVQAA